MQLWRVEQASIDGSSPAVQVMRVVQGDPLNGYFTVSSGAGLLTIDQILPAAGFGTSQGEDRRAQVARLTKEWD